MTSSITCSVTPSCGSSIVITAIDISLHSDSTGCLQSLHVVDGSTVKTFTCDDNNQYDVRTIYTSSSHFVKLTFNSNVTADAGKLWIQLNGNCLSLSVFHHPSIHPYVHTYISTYVRTYMQTYIPAYTSIRSYVHTYLHTYIHSSIHTYVHTYLHTFIHAYIHTYTTHTSSHPSLHTYIH